MLGIVERPLYEQTVTTARSRLDEEAFAAAWAEGQAMTLEEAIDYTRQAKEAQDQ